jgi:RNA polymerase sigma-70 factor (ECF subfamily)
MSTEREIEIRERLTRHWLSVEPVVRAYVAASIRSFVDRDDVVQQVALTVARRFEEYDPTRPFLPWVLWLAKSRIADFHRQQGRQRTLLSSTHLDELAVALVEMQPTVSARRAALEECLERLTADARQLIELRYHQQWPITQIATSRHSTPGSIRVTLFRIREVLANCIRRRLALEELG